MKQIFMVICLACVCLGKSEKSDKQKRGISISAPYSSVSYAPGFPLYGGVSFIFDSLYIWIKLIIFFII